MTEGASTFDYNAGATGNEFAISFTGRISCGVYACSGTSTITLSNLNFSGGEALTGFSTLSSVFADVFVNILSPTSLSLSWTEPGPGNLVGPEVLLAGDFITQPLATPLPALLPLFATGLGALALLGWRRKRTARSIAA